MNLDFDVPGLLRRNAVADEAGAGDGAAEVSALYAEHALSLIRLAHIMLGNPAAAEDVVQEAYCGLYRRWSHLRDQSRALGYLRSSVLNGCRSVLRLGTSLQLDEAQQPSVSPADTAVLTAESRREIVRAVRKLPNRQREVIVLRFFLELPDDQIASILRITQGTVRSAAHRGLISLRQALKETSS